MVKLTLVSINSVCHLIIMTITSVVGDVRAVDASLTL